MSDPREGICAIIMAKDENRFILHEDGSRPKPEYTMLEQNIRRLNQLVEEIYIIDNASTDHSRSVYEKYKTETGNGNICYVQYNPKDWKFDDVRDRKVLLEVAHKREMKWALIIDGDEIYEERATEWLHNFCKTKNWEDHHIAKFHYINFWRGRTRYRTDAWNKSWFQRLFSMKDLVLEGEALHNYRFHHKGSESRYTEAPVKCLHYGWADWQHRVAKTQRYMERDMQLSGITHEQAKHKYSQDVNEQGLKLEKADPLWGEEFRTGNIGY